MQTILVVDDDESVRSMIELILQIEGFTVLTAASGFEALAITRSRSVDVVTIDLSMPGMNGWELSAQLRAEPTSAHCRQMLVSGMPNAVELAGPSDHVDAFLEKPFDLLSFTDALMKLVADSTAGEVRHPLADELDRILDERLVTTLFQPIVDLATLHIVGVEALSRGPVGSALHMPEQLFAIAHQAGRLHELDELCRDSAILAARRSGKLAPPLVFINVEPNSSPTEILSEETVEPPLLFQLVVEFTERALTLRLPALMRHAEEVRAKGHVIALDDLGVDPRAVALLPLLEPEIVKLDMSLLAKVVTEQAATTAVAVAAYAERSGARVVAEGIETQEQLATAVALGAHWGQGWLFGHPGSIADIDQDVVRQRRPALPKRAPRQPADATPFSLAAQGKPTQRGNVVLLDQVCWRLEQQAMALGDVGVVLVAIQHEQLLPSMVVKHYDELAERVAFLGFLGQGVVPEPLHGAYGVDLDPDDPLCQELVLAVLGPHSAAMLCARDLGDSGPREKRRYDFVLSHDRELVDDVARLLTRRFTPRWGIPRTTALPRQVAQS